MHMHCRVVVAMAWQVGRLVVRLVGWSVDILCRATVEKDEAAGRIESSKRAQWKTTGRAEEFPNLFAIVRRRNV